MPSGGVLLTAAPVAADFPLSRCRSTSRRTGGTGTDDPVVQGMTNPFVPPAPAEHDPGLTLADRVRQRTRDGVADAGLDKYLCTAVGWRRHLLHQVLPDAAASIASR